MLTPSHISRLRERGIDLNLAQSLGFSSANDETLRIEYRRQGQLHNAKLRRGKGNMPWETRDRDLILWNGDCLLPPAHPDEALVITEGEFDTLALLQAGLNRVVSVPNGAPSSPEDGGSKRFSYLYKPGTDELLPEIDQFKTIVLAVDVDSAGVYLRDALAVRLGAERCLWVEWPAGCKDANDALLAHGAQNLLAMAMGAKRMWLDHVARLSDIPDAEDMPVYQVGHDLMDQELEAGGIRLPQVGFVVISGPANHGKSTFARQLCWHLWRQYGSPFAVTAFEEDAKPTYQKEFRRLAIGKPPKVWALDEVGRADIQLDSALVVILRPPGGAAITLERVLANAEFAIKVYGVRVLLVDPANEIDRDERNYSEATGKMILALKDLATRYRVLVICVAHPPADIVRRKRETDLWTLYDVEGSRHWAGRADAGFMLWRSGEHTMVYAAKLKRFDEMGKRTLYQCRHDWETNTLVAIAAGDHLLQQAATDKVLGANGAKPAAPPPMSPWQRAGVD